MRQIFLNRPDGTSAVIYDPTMLTERPVIGPKGSLELSEAGNIEFTILPGHPLYDEIVPLSSYITVLEDGEEIFYGRVLQRGVPTLTGLVTISCEGALAFLLDSEVPSDDKNSNGTSQSRKLTAETFFRWCIQQHNAEVNDPRRQFTVGTISANKKSKEDTYSITSWTQTKSAIESYITGIYGGIIRVRPKNGGGHYIDWIQQYERVNPQAISVGVNVEDQTNQFDGDQLFTAIRPIGNDGLTLPEKTLNLYSSEDIAKYGKIVKSVEFRNATTEADLRSQANDYIRAMYKTLFINSSIKLVDMHYIDGTNPMVRLGDRFTNIHGLEGTEMTVATMQLDFEHPENDTLEMKNQKSLTPDMTPEGNGHGDSRISRSHAKSSGLGLKYYKEFNDLAQIVVPKLEINVDNLGIYVRDEFQEVAGSFERISSRVQTVEELGQEHERLINGIQYDVREIQGTAVIQNSDMISNVAGQFEIWEDAAGHKIVHLTNGAEMAIDDASGATITVGQRLNQTTQEVDAITGSALWTQRDHITGVSGEFDVKYDVDEQGRPIKTLVINSGGGMNITKDGVEYGVYMTPESAYIEVEVPGDTNPYAHGYYEKDANGRYFKTSDLKPVPGKKYYKRNTDVSAVLTGGLIVQKLDDGTVTTNINGNIINLKVNGDFNQLTLDVAGLTNTVTDIDGNMSVLSNTVEGLSSTVTDVAGNMSVLSNTVDGLESTVTDVEGNVSTLSNTVSGMQSTVTDIEGNVSTLSNTVLGLESTVENVEGDVSTLTNTVEGLTSTVSDVQGNVSTLSNTVSGLSSTVTDVQGNVSTLSNTVSGLLSTVTDVQGNVSTLSNTVSGLSSTVTDVQGNVSTLSNTVSGLSSTVSDVQGNVSTLSNTVDGVTAITGEFEVVTDPSTGKKTIVVKSGGGMKVRRDNVEYGLYDNGNLTGGIMVQKLNGQTLTTINGTAIKAGGSSTIEAEVTATELAKFGLVDSNGNFTAGLVVDLINNSSDTQAVINASKIIFDGNTTLAGALNMVSGQLKVEKQAVFSDNVWLSGNKNLTLQGSGALVFSGAQQADSITIDNSTLKNALKSADVLNSVVHFKTYSNTDALTVSKSGNVLTFTDADGHTLSFSKATTVGGSWGGSTTRDQYTVNVTQNNETVGSKTIGFQQGSEVQMSVQSNLNDTDYPLDVSSGTIIRVPIKVVRQNDITGNLDTPAWRDRITVNISNVLESKSVSANGTYTPASGYAGFSQVVVNVPSGELSNVRTRFNASSGQYYFEAFDQVSGNPIPNTSNTYQLGVSGTKVQIQKTDGTKYDNTPEYSIPAPTVSGWSLGDYVSPYSYKASVNVNGTTYTSGTLNAVEAYGKGWTNCYGNIEQTTTSNQSALDYGQSVTIKAMAYSTKDATTKTAVSTLTYTAPSFPTVSDWSLGSYTSPYSYKASVKVGGTAYTSGTLNAVEAYGKGWTNCYGGIEQTSTSNVSALDYGQTVTITTKAYSTKDATAKTEVSSLTYTAPSFPTVSGWSLGSYTSPYSYKASVTVGGTTYTSGTLNAVDAYAKGWTNCYGNIEQTTTSNLSALDYGQSVTIKAMAYSTKDATAKTAVSTLTYTAPSFPTVSDWSLGSYTSPYSYTASVKVGGTTYTSGTLNAVDAYAKGWTNCYGNIEQTTTSNLSALDYGQTVTITTKAYSTKDATAKTDVSTLTYTAPSFPTVSGWSLGSYTSPYSYKASVTVGGTTYTSGTLNAVDAYAKGWTNCYGSVEQTTTSNLSALDYGQSVTITTKAYSTKDATVKTEVSKLTYTAPADNWHSGYASCYQSASSLISALDYGQSVTITTKGKAYSTDTDDTTISTVTYTAPADNWQNGYNGAHVAGSWSSNLFTYQKTTSGSANSASFYVGSTVAMQQGTCYTYATWWSSSSTTPSSISGTSKKVTIVNSTDNSVKLQLAGSDVGYTFTHSKYNAGFNAVGGNDITLCGSGSSPQSSKPSFAATWTETPAGKKKLSASIWAKHTDGKWYYLRDFSFTEP